MKVKCVEKKKRKIRTGGGNTHTRTWQGKGDGKCLTEDEHLTL